jgi:DNA-binding YbaB/EbfC family protein
MFDKAKMVMKLRGIQKKLADEVIEVQTGDGAVTVKISGDQKIKGIKLDPEKFDSNDLGKMEKYLESAVTQAIARSQEFAAEEMKEISGSLGLPGM